VEPTIRKLLGLAPLLENPIRPARGVGQMTPVAGNRLKAAASDTPLGNYAFSSFARHRFPAVKLRRGWPGASGFYG
jgi:hypothetical protein